MRNHNEPKIVEVEPGKFKINPKATLGYSEHFGVDMDTTTPEQIRLSQAITARITMELNATQDNVVFNLVRGWLLLGALKDKKSI